MAHKTLEKQPVSSLSQQILLPLVASWLPGESFSPVRILSMNLHGDDCPSLTFFRLLHEYIAKYNIEVILLQEADKLELDYINLLENNKEVNNWFYVREKGLMTLWNESRFRAKVDTDETGELLTLLGSFWRTGLPVEFAICNINNTLNPFPENQELRYKTVFKKTGDMPVVIASESENPLDGCFYRSKGGDIQPLRMERLSLKSGSYRKRTGADYAFFMAMAFDTASQQKKTIGGQTLFEYQTALKKRFGDDQILVRMANDSSNNQAVAIRFSQNSPFYPSIKQSVSKIEGVQSKTLFCPTEKKEYDCLFVPLKKAHLLHKACNTAYLSVLKNKVADKLDSQINKLSQSHWYFNKAEDKIERLTLLREAVFNLDITSSAETILNTIKNWEDGDTGAEIDVRNIDVIARHRNKLFAPSKPTSTFEVLTSIKQGLKEIKTSSERGFIASNY
ncbi:MAG: hypothetical protein WC785_01180 [Tatlockia sp.]|jgi:hypothetical protein